MRETRIILGMSIELVVPARMTSGLNRRQPC